MHEGESTPKVESPPAPETARGTGEVTTGKVPTKETSQRVPVLAFSLELSITADDLAKLTAEQIASLFAGVGQVAAIKAALTES